MLCVKPQRTLAELKTLARFGQVGTGVNRRSMSAEDIAARRWLLACMREAGLHASIDEVGTVSGRTPNSQRYVLIGSHTDTVPNGGWLDGSMGVMFGLEIARAWVEAQRPADVGIEVVSFNDEEGRYRGLLGSSVFVGDWTPAEARALRSEDGVSLGAAVDAAGWSTTSAAHLDPTRHCGYFEAHIEQGPRLEDSGAHIGAVTEIVGVRRARVEFLGRADHAGTVPMAMRQDAAAATFAFAHEFANYCAIEAGENTVWNLGAVQIEPGAYNVVSARSVLSVEYRDGNSATLDQISDYMSPLAQQIAARYRVACDVMPQMGVDPAIMDDELISEIEAAARAQGARSLRLASGAGHDAMLFAARIPTAMLFVPSIGGRSHDLSEDTKEADIVLGLEVLAGAVDRVISN